MAEGHAQGPDPSPSPIGWGWFPGLPPVHGFINGEYFGLFNLRERANEHFLAAKAKLLPQEIEMVDGFLTPIHGNHNSIQKAFDWLRSQDPDRQIFDRLIRRFDIDQFIDYLAIQIYVNKDWPHNNVTLGVRPGLMAGCRR